MIALWCAVLGTGMIYIASRPWAFETIETSIAVKMYEASELLGLCTEKEKESKLYLGKSLKLVKKAIGKLNSLSSHLLEKKSNLFSKEFAVPLIRLRRNLERRILPRIAHGEDTVKMTSVLSGLAKLFGEASKPISLDDIISKNKDLELYEEASLEEKTIVDNLKLIASTKPVLYLCSIVVGYISATVIILGACQFFEMNFADTVQTNLFNWALLGAAFTGGIIAIILKK